jgi:hypothetical protein
VNSIITEPGSSRRPAPVASRPKPKPVDSGSSASCGISRNEPNMPKPTSSVATLVISTGGLSSVGMSASGCSVRRSTATHTASTAAPAASSASVRGLPQPQSLAREIAISGIARPAPSSAAPRTSTRPGLRSGDSGTHSCVATAASAAEIAPSQKIQW